MSVKLLFTMAVILSVSGCGTSNSIISSNKILKIDFMEKNLSGHIVNFEIKNISQKDVYLYKPESVLIEKLVSNSWESVRILDCPCDAPCNSPSDWGILKPGQVAPSAWNQKESYCGKKTSAGIRKTISKSVGLGSYRLITTYKIGDKKAVLFNEFVIN